jgi:hypothetical protein
MRRTRATHTQTRESFTQNFSAKGDRKRLSPAAIRAVRNVAGQWEITGAEVASLLGVSTRAWHRMSVGSWEGSLSQDQLTRVSALVGIFKGLHLFFADDMADRWVRLRNKGILFANRTPIEAMMEGGISMMIDVRRHVDELRGEM